MNTNDRIKSLLQTSGAKGRTVAEVQAALRLQRGAVGDRLRTGYQEGLWFRGGEEKHYRYFSTAEFCAAYPFAEDAAARAEKSKEAKRLRTIRETAKRRGDRPARPVVDYWPPMEALLRARGRAGATMLELSDAVKLNRRTAWVWVSRYIDDGRAFTLGSGSLARYYIEKPAEQIAPKQSPWRQETPTKRNTTHQPKRPVEIINPGVPIQRIPCSNDYRFSVSPHFKGEFSREWQEKRA